MATYRTTWGADAVEVNAEFRQAAAEMRHALADMAAADGLSQFDEDTRDLIDYAVSTMVEVTFPGVSKEQVLAAARACREAAANEAEWDSPEAADARSLTEELGWTWDFTNWDDAAYDLERIAREQC